MYFYGTWHKCVVSALILQVIEEARDDHDSIGGVVTCVCRNVPVGLGEPSFDKLEALLAHGMLSIPATKGFEIGTARHLTVSLCLPPSL